MFIKRAVREENNSACLLTVFQRTLEQVELGDIDLVQIHDLLFLLNVVI